MFPESRGRQVWRIVYPILIFLAIPNLVAFVAGLYQGIQYAIQSPDAFQNPAILNEFLVEWLAQNTLVLTMIGQLLCLAPLVPMWVSMRRRMPLFDRKASPTTLGLLAIPAFFGLSLLVGLLLSFVDVGEMYEALEAALSSGSVVIRFVTLAVVAPVVEELCFRGIILNRSLSWMRPWTAVILQAAMFGVGHMNLVQGLYAFAVGMMFGYLYLRFRNLWLCIIGHFAFNLPSVLLDIIKDTGVEITAIRVLIIGAGLLVAVFFLYRLPAAVPVTIFDNRRFPDQATPWQSPDTPERM